MIYTTCKYAPEELFEGFGLETERLDPNPLSFSCADGCAHPNLCGFAKAVIEEVEAKQIKDLVFTDCCDAMRRTYDVLLGKQMEFLYFLALPHKSGEIETALFAQELKMLADTIAGKSGRSFSWEKAMDACGKRLRVTQQEPERSTACQNGECISVEGAHGGSMLIRQIREIIPDIPVVDNTCSGNRYFTELPGAGSVDSEESFFLWYAELLLKGFKPCMRMLDARTASSRQDAFTEEDRRSGIIYHTIKFCDYYSFEYTELKNKVRAPLLKIETDTTPQSSGQLKTRIEAFGETLEASMKRPFGKCAQKSSKDENPASAASAASAAHEARASAGASDEKPYVAGIDSGSTSTDVVIMDRKQNILGEAILPTGMSASRSAREALEAAMRQAGITAAQLGDIIATGYGRDTLDLGQRTITEITCHARGAHFLFPDARTIIDIGGQDSKVIRVDEDGNVISFIMNDKCAAGTGRFLEMQARALGLPMEEMSSIGLKWKQEVQISNMCTVFAESEVVSLVAQDTDIADIVHGLNQSVAAKTVSLISRGKGEPGYAMTGGVSHNQGVVQCLKDRLQAEVQISDRSQLCGAIGAALFGAA